MELQTVKLIHKNGNPCVCNAEDAPGLIAAGWMLAGEEPAQVAPQEAVAQDEPGEADIDPIAEAAQASGKGKRNKR